MMDSLLSPPPLPPASYEVSVMPDYWDSLRKGYDF